MTTGSTSEDGAEGDTAAQAGSARPGGWRSRTAERSPDELIHIGAISRSSDHLDERLLGLGPFGPLASSPRRSAFGVLHPNGRRTPWPEINSAMAAMKTGTQFRYRSQQAGLARERQLSSLLAPLAVSLQTPWNLLLENSVLAGLRDQIRAVPDFI